MAGRNLVKDQPPKMSEVNNQTSLAHVPVHDQKAIRKTCSPTPIGPDQAEGRAV